MPDREQVGKIAREWVEKARMTSQMQPTHLNWENDVPQIPFVFMLNNAQKSI